MAPVSLWPVRQLWMPRPHGARLAAAPGHSPSASARPGPTRPGADLSLSPGLRCRGLQALPALPELPGPIQPLPLLPFTVICLSLSLVALSGGSGLCSGCRGLNYSLVSSDCLSPTCPRLSPAPQGRLRPCTGPGLAAPLQDTQPRPPTLSAQPGMSPHRGGVGPDSPKRCGPLPSQCRDPSFPAEAVQPRPPPASELPGPGPGSVGPR